MYGGSVLRFGRNNVGSKGSRRRLAGLADVVGFADVAGLTRFAGLAEFAERLESSQLRQVLQAVEIAAHAKTAIAGELAVMVEDRQSRQFDRQTAAAVDGPVHDDTAPGLAGRDRLRH